MGNFKNYYGLFSQAMDDDFNTPEALAVFFDIAKEINRIKKVKPLIAGQLGFLLKEMGESLGLLEQEPENYLKWGKSESNDLSDDFNVLIVP